MVAYSFKRRFVDPIRVGLAQPIDVPATKLSHVTPKRQTIRAERKRHAQPGEELQLYCGMRTRGCFLIGHARCIAVEPVRLKFTLPQSVDVGGAVTAGLTELNKFAKLDGFRSWADMVVFWSDEHPDVSVFSGVRIRWEPLRS